MRHVYLNYTRLHSVIDTRQCIEYPLFVLEVEELIFFIQTITNEFIVL